MTAITEQAREALRLAEGDPSRSIGLTTEAVRLAQAGRPRDRGDRRAALTSPWPISMTSTRRSGTSGRPSISPDAPVSRSSWLMGG
jgi:hypothetical protein